MARRWWALGAVILAVFAAGLDATVLSVALPTLAAVLHASELDLQWYSAGYFMVLAAAMLPAGLLGDRCGRRAVMVVSLALFGAGSAACAFAQTSAAFMAARLVLGLAGAGVIVMAVSALTVLFDEAERPRAVGMWAAANFLSLPIGPILGGWLLTHAWWGWIFLMNVPVTILGLVAVLALVPESRAPVRPALDPLGIALSAAGLVGMTYGLIEAGAVGWGAAAALLPLAAGLLALTLFWAWERRARHPLIEPALFASPSFTWGVVTMTVAVLAMIGVLFIMPQYFQGVAGDNALGSGLRLLTMVAGLVLGAVPADRLAARIGAGRTVALGSALLGVALLAGARTTVASSATFVAVWMGVAGLGMGLAMATAASAALSELPAERSGVASAVLQALKNVGSPLGAAVMGSVLNAGYQSHVAVGALPAAAAGAVRQSVFAGIALAARLGSATLLASVRAAFVAGLDQVLLLSAGVAVLGGILALAFLPGREVAAPAERSHRMS